MKNQKTISQEEQEKIIAGREKAKKEREHKKETLQKYRDEIFESKRKELPSIISQRTKEIADELAKDIYVDGLESIVIHSIIASPRILPARFKLTNDELFIAFDEYKKVMLLINQKVRYTPSIQSFCSFIGISTQMYKNYLNDTDDERRNIMQMIDDYITGSILGASQRREIDSSTSMFVVKAQHGIVEQPQRMEIAITKANFDIDDIMSDIEKIKNKGSIVDVEFSEKGEK